jgi:hypothetical protein
MKKNLFFTVFVCACLASCVNESETLLKESKGQRLTFGAPVMYNQSRAVEGEIDGTTYPEDESFTVFGIEHEGAFTAWNASNVFSFFPTAGEVVTKSQTENYWYTEKDYYLPTEPNRFLSFAAYSPSRAKDNGTISYGENGLTITDWRMPDTGMYDLMYSTRNTDVKTDVVNIAFLHALSSIHINFAMSTENGPSSVVVTKVAIKNTDIKNVGTFNDNITTTTDGTGAAWTDLKATNLPTEYVILNSEYNVTTTPTEPDASVDFLPIPQDVLNKTLVISYNIRMKETEEYQVVENLEIPFKDFKVNGAVKTTEWERATRYFYTVTFGGLTKIKFNPSVENWTTESDAGTYVIQ